MKKLGILFAVLIMSLMFAVSASALEPTGQCGDNVYWEYDETTGELIISGEGPMVNYSNYYYSPFYESNITSIIIEDDVTTIGSSAFAHCYSLTSVILGDCITTISSQAFQFCNNLTSVTIPDGVTTIGYCAFSSCANLTSVILGDSVITIGNYAFSNCASLTSITIPDSVTTIGYCAFSSCANLTSVIIGNSVTTIGDYAFYVCDSLTNIIVDAANTLYSSDSTGVLFDKSKTILIQYPAGNTNSSYVIPDSVTTINYLAFYNCNSLTSVIMTDSVITIGDGAFCDCYRLESVYYKGFKEQWDDIEIGTYNENLLDADIQYHYGEHLYNADVTDPTCKDKGFTTYTCECGDSYVADYVKENGHSFTNYISDGKATCVTDGSLIAKCDNCDKTDIKPEKGGHNFSTDFTIDLDPTCTSEGQKSRRCLNCTEKTDVTVIGKLAHTYSEAVTIPTCTTQGYTTYICYCGDTYKSNYVDKLDHKDDNGDYKCDYNCGYEFEKPAPEVPNEPTTPDESEEELNFFEKIIKWFKDLFDKLFGWLK